MSRLAGISIPKVCKTKDYPVISKGPCTFCRGYPWRTAWALLPQKFPFTNKKPLNFKSSVTGSVFFFSACVYMNTFLVTFTEKEKKKTKTKPGISSTFSWYLHNQVKTRTSPSPIFLLILPSFSALLSRWMPVSAVGNPAPCSLP